MQIQQNIHYCKACGSPTRYAVPEHEQMARAICTRCALVHYENPLNVVGTIPAWGEQVLLCKRNIEPRRGFWTLPAGFMELGETAAQGAMRETIEEAGAHIELQDLYALLNVVHVGQVHFFYRAKLLNTSFNPGVESTEVRLFSQAQVPWNELAFRTVSTTLEHYFKDQSRGHYELVCVDL
jgi:ADP-ribose pyrophosphatase YjhB (NUDIX family)